MTSTTRVHWRRNLEGRYPFGRTSPDPERWEPIGFPPPWPDRPWIYGVMVASANGIVAWKRKDASDDPVLTVLGGDESRPERIADRRQMRFYRSFGDAGVGAQTNREQRRLVQTPQEPGDEPVPELYRFRLDHGLPYHPRNIIYSLYGRLELDHPVFNTPGLEAVVVTTEVGAGELAIRGAGERGIPLIVEPTLDADGLRRAHERLFADRGVRYLACEGGDTILRALHAANLLDEVFLTVADVEIDESQHEDILRIFDFADEGAELVGEGRIAPASGFTFQRWRFNFR
jgi:riboflavin biosynthesis pyrimidine reductase